MVTKPDMIFYISLNMPKLRTFGRVTTASGAELRNFLNEKGLSSLGLLDLFSSLDLSFLLDDDVDDVAAPSFDEASTMSPFTFASGRERAEGGGGGGLDMEIATGGAGGKDGDMRSMEGKGT